MAHAKTEETERTRGIHLFARRDAGGQASRRRTCELEEFEVAELGVWDGIVGDEKALVEIVDSHVLKKRILVLNRGCYVCSSETASFCFWSHVGNVHTCLEVERQAA